MLFRRWIVLIVCALACGLLVAAEAEWEYEAILDSGYDSNPLKLSEAERGAVYTEAALHGGVEVDLTAGTPFFANADVGVRRHGSSLSDADYETAKLEAGFDLTPFRNGARRVTVEAGSRFLMRRSTFTSRRSGEIFRISDGGTSVPIPERFDSNQLEGFVDVTWRINRRARLYLNTTYASKNYVEDYDEVADLESLDYFGFTFEPGVRFEVSKSVGLEASLVSTDRDYDGRTAVDGSGTSVPGTTREYRYAGYDFTVRIDPKRSWRWTAGVRTLDRDDTFAGYYSYATRSEFVTARVNFLGNNRIRVSASHADQDYDHSTVNDEVNGELRSSKTLRIKGAYTRELFRRLALTVDVATTSTDNVDPDYTYDRYSYGLWLSYK